MLVLKQAKEGLRKDFIVLNHIHAPLYMMMLTCSILGETPPCHETLPTVLHHLYNILIQKFFPNPPTTVLPPI
jgi:hypothetical protein